MKRPAYLRHRAAVGDNVSLRRARLREQISVLSGIIFAGCTALGRRQQCRLQDPNEGRPVLQPARVVARDADLDVDFVVLVHIMHGSVVLQPMETYVVVKPADRVRDLMERIQLTTSASLQAQCLLFRGAAVTRTMPGCRILDADVRRVAPLVASDYSKLDGIFASGYGPPWSFRPAGD